MTSPIDLLKELAAEISPTPWCSVSDEAGDRGLAMVYDGNDLPIGDFSDEPASWRSGALAQSEDGRDCNARLAALAPLLLAKVIADHEALGGIARHEHNAYSEAAGGADYATGVADGHRCAANLADQALDLSEITTALEGE